MYIVYNEMENKEDFMIGYGLANQKMCYLKDLQMTYFRLNKFNTCEHIGAKEIIVRKSMCCYNIFKTASCK